MLKVKTIFGVGSATIRTHENFLSSSNDRNAQAVPQGENAATQATPNTTAVLKMQTLDDGPSSKGCGRRCSRFVREKIRLAWGYGLRGACVSSQWCTAAQHRIPRQGSNYRIDPQFLWQAAEWTSRPGADRAARPGGWCLVASAGGVTVRAQRENREEPHSRRLPADRVAPRAAWALSRAELPDPPIVYGVLSDRRQPLPFIRPSSVNTPTTFRA